MISGADPCAPAAVRHGVRLGPSGPLPAHWHIVTHVGADVTPGDRRPHAEAGGSVRRHPFGSTPACPAAVSRLLPVRAYGTRRPDPARARPPFPACTKDRRGGGAGRGRRGHEAGLCRGRCAASPVADHRAGRGRRLRITRFHPSLHLDPADGHRRLGSFDPAGEHAPPPPCGRTRCLPAGRPRRGGGGRLPARHHPAAPHARPRRMTHRDTPLTAEGRRRPSAVR